MRMNITALSGATILCLAMLSGCMGGGGGDGGSDTTPVATASPAETVLGVALLPPDGVVPAASSIASEDMPPSVASASSTPDSDDLPPA